jgi:uncharacterized protein (DUF2384 family)
MPLIPPLRGLLAALDLTAAEAEAWLGKPHPLLGGRAPRALIDAGLAVLVLDLLADCLRGFYA